MEKTWFAIISCLLIASLNSCAFDLVHVKQIPIDIEATQTPKNSFLLEKEVTFSLETGYGRILKQGTKWDFVGTVSYGDIFQTTDQILTIEASNCRVPSKMRMASHLK